MNNKDYDGADFNNQLKVIRNVNNPVSFEIYFSLCHKSFLEILKKTENTLTLNKSQLANEIIDGYKNKKLITDDQHARWKNYKNIAKKDYDKVMEDNQSFLSDMDDFIEDVNCLYALINAKSNQEVEL